MSSSKIRVIARVRPINEMEQQFIDNGAGEIIVKILNDKSLLITTENQSFTLDGAYNSDTQSNFYFNAASETVDEVLKGYNGTIFAYGPTGTGKTYTMLGLNISNQELMGIIPRTSSQIFKHIDSNDIETEYEIRCSMLEIYKENLRDLLSLEECNNTDLKIKESPDRGIFVDGLTEKCVTNQEEFMDIVQIGGRKRAVAETRHNQNSSRSHTIFMLQITQKYPNGSEKRGKLNLVDLAGSEKLPIYGGDDERMEETKKINKSLSALGNVIHALTSNSDHVPYRDSKLTRILQESLGGNYKTTLIITVSPFSGNKEESLSSLKFAQRASHVKNRVRVNMHHSPGEYNRIIEQLRNELRETKLQLQECMQNCSEVVKTLPNLTDENKSDADSTIKLETMKKKSYHENSVAEEGKSQVFINNSEQASTINYAEIVADKDRWKLKAEQLSREVVTLKSTIEDNAKTIQKLKEKLTREKMIALRAEQKATKGLTAKAIVDLKEQKEKLENKDRSFQTEILQKEVESLVMALEESERECKILLTQKRGQFLKVIEEEMKGKTEFKEYNIEKYFTALLNDDKFMRGSFVSSTEYMQTIKKTGENANRDVVVLFAEPELRNISQYSKEVEEAMEESKIPAEVQIFLLKQQLVDAAMYNRSLQSVIFSLEWKLFTEQMKSKQKTSYAEVLEKSNVELDKVLSETYISYCELGRRIGKFEEEVEELNDMFSNIMSGSQSPETSSMQKLPLNAKTRIIKRFKRSMIEKEGEVCKPTARKDIFDEGKECASPCLAECDGDSILSEETEEITKLNNKILELKAELNLQMARADQLNKCYLCSKENIIALKSIATDTEEASNYALKKEINNWKSITNTLKVKIKY